MTIIATIRRSDMIDGFTGCGDLSAPTMAAIALGWGPFKDTPDMALFALDATVGSGQQEAGCKMIELKLGGLGG